METRSENVVVTRDGGHDCYDTTITARDIAKAFKYGLLEVDPTHQRGKNTVTGKYVLKQDKVDRWARELQEDKAIFGQLTWNFRPESSDVQFLADHDNQYHGTLVVRDGTAFLPDSVHRHYAIETAVQSIAAGSSFDPSRRFSLRIWQVPEKVEDDIFFAMNMEHDKADATRSKWLAQKNLGQKLAALVVRSSPHLGESNIETVSNTLSKKNHRLAAFNTISNAFEDAWSDIPVEDGQKVVTWFIGFWDKLVDVRPELGRLNLAQRQKARSDSLVGWALTIHGYIRLARRFYDEGLDLALLERLTDKHTEPDGQVYDFFDWKNPLWQRAGIVVPAENKAGKQTLTVRNSHQTRRAMAKTLAEKLQLPDSEPARV
ncbi:MAG TPA: DNA sulfur modification protein DndB [Acidimicrobiales bacterium]|jgi:hypothetical protein